MEIAKAIFLLCVAVVEVSGVRFCGKQLADMLDLVCANRGFHWMASDAGVPHIAKRTFQYPSMTSTPPPSSSGGVVSECCRKACRLSDLESYCASPESQARTPSPSLARLFTQETTAPVNPFPNPTQAPLVVSTGPPPSIAPPRNRFRFPLGASARVLGYRFGTSNGNKFFFVGHVGARPTRSPSL